MVKRRILRLGKHMPLNYPKFENKIQNQIDQSKMRQARGRPGIIMAYDIRTNSASILVDDQMSGQIGNIMHDVPCPVSVGIQMVAPEPGTRCYVQFRDDNEGSAYVAFYFDQHQVSSSYSRNYTVNTGIPKYMSR